MNSIQQQQTGVEKLIAKKFFFLLKEMLLSSNMEGGQIVLIYLVLKIIRGKYKQSKTHYEDYKEKKS